VSAAAGAFAHERELGGSPEHGRAPLFIRLKARAKINFWLEVLGKRRDGYHELSSLMLPVGICDDIRIDVTDKGISLACDHPEIPSDASNLAWRAAQAYLEASGWSAGVRLALRKRIPAGAGLGGGSSDAAAVLRGLDRLAPGPLPRSRLEGLARELGADVPFFLRSRPALATGVGEKLREVEGIPPYPLVLVKPPVHVSTGEVYRRLKLTRGRSRITIAQLLTRPWQPRSLMQNDLESVTMKACPVVGGIKEWLAGCRGVLGTVMSGSGPTVVGVFGAGPEAGEAGAAARNAWKGSWVAVTAVEVP